MFEENLEILNKIDINTANEYVNKKIKVYLDKNDINYNNLSNLDYDALQNVINNNKTQFDIFLSNRIRDKEIIIKLYYYLENNLRYRVYVDWIVDSKLNRANVTKKSVATLKIRLKNSRSFLLAKTPSFRSSKWIMWEVGYYDAVHNAFMAQLDIGKTSIKRLEFLQYCKKSYLSCEDIVVLINGKHKLEWRNWIK